MMKKIKRFNESIKESGFSEITQQEFNELNKRYKSINFPTEAISSIHKLIKNPDYAINHHQLTIIKTTNKFGDRIRYHISSKEDEWFVIFDQTSTHFWICDQIEGLINFLESKNMFT